ncbi:MAG: hypothetical protein QM730_21130 [Anaerolineales bacterium]
MNSSEEDEMIYPNKIRFMFSFFMYCLLFLIPMAAVLSFFTGKALDLGSYIPVFLIYLFSSYVSYPFYSLTKDQEIISGATVWGNRNHREQIKLSDIDYEKTFRQKLGKILGIYVIYSKQGKKILTLGLNDLQISIILEFAKKHETDIPK